ncbi:hypothetical protein IQ238_01745 [Pleurocapsales cyanobacterium LEGE 06147]|nr:hypothetical protein [Pleurocapsales cyanobacterium LEGE 06147]
MSLGLAFLLWLVTQIKVNSLPLTNEFPLRATNSGNSIGIVLLSQTDTSTSNELTISDSSEIKTDDSKSVHRPTKASSVQPLKTYVLTLLPGGARFSVNIRPPATKIVVTLLSGDMAVRCGDRLRNYSCIPGKRLEISAEPTNAIAQFWGENAYQTEMRLRIDVYEVAGEDSSSKVSNSS